MTQILQAPDVEEDFPVPTIRWAGTEREPQAATVPTRPVIAIEVPDDWATGCGLCGYGILSAPELHGRVPFYEERRIQFQAGEIQFCECKAGQTYRRCLAKAAKKADEERR